MRRVHGYLPFPAVVAFTFVLVVAGAGAACKKKPAKAGDTCPNEWATACTDKSDALVCVSGKLEAVPCRGATGCMDTGDGGNECSNDAHDVGEPCKEEGNYGCSLDAKALLKCDAMRWTKAQDCKGANGCAPNAQGATCDQRPDVSTCKSQDEGNGSCSADGKSLVLCRSGKMVVAATCKGPGGCRQQGDDIDCNQTIADVGDPCREGKYACATDKTTRLLCWHGKMISEKVCKSCSVVKDEVQCE
jgi:hypothetical protein